LYILQRNISHPPLIYTSLHKKTNTLHNLFGHTGLTTCVKKENQYHGKQLHLTSMDQIMYKGDILLLKKTKEADQMSKL
jgi:hypothetical protein